jgi:hypothetical protein
MFKILARTHCKRFVSLYRKSSDVSKKKFIPAFKVLNRILWDPALSKEEFIIGYEDRFLGILEIPIDEYQQSEVKDHRI